MGWQCENTRIGNSKPLPSVGSLAISSPILTCASLMGQVPGCFRSRINVRYRLAETLLSQKRSSSRWTRRMPWRCGARTKSVRKLLIEPSRANAYSTKERSNTGPMTVCIDKTRSPSVVFTLWPAWTSFSRMGGCSAPDS